MEKGGPAMGLENPTVHRVGRAGAEEQAIPAETERSHSRARMTSPAPRASTSFMSKAIMSSSSFYRLNISRSSASVQPSWISALRYSRYSGQSLGPQA
jgi:hypothetical protein